MTLILLDAAGVVSGRSADAAATGPPLLDGLTIGASLADRLHRQAAAGDADAAALHRGLLGLLAGQLDTFEHRQGGWRIALDRIGSGGAAAAALVAGRVTEAEPASAVWQRQRERLEELLVSRTVQLAQASERADAASRLRSGLLAQASHDIRTPLQAIVSLAHLLEGSLSDPEQLRRVQTIGRSARQLGSLFDTVLARALGEAAATVAAAPDAPAPMPAAADAAAQLRRRHAGRRVLLAEDDDINQLAMLELLSAVGLEVDIAKDGHQAVDLASGRSYALILLDLRMPRLDGLAAARTLRTLPGLQATPIVAISANAFEEDRRACRAAGMNDFLAKPVEVPRLYGLLLRWLDARPDGARGDAAAAAAAAPRGDAPTDAVAAMAPLLGVEGIDAVRGLAAVGGRPAVYRRLLRVFVETHAGDGERLQHLVQRGDGAAAGALAHRLRGSAATLGLIAVETAAGALEGAIDDAVDATALPRLAQAVAETLGDALARLDAALAP